MAQRFVIRLERPDTPDVAVLLAALDSYLATLYAPEANHILDGPALLAPEVGFFVARESGRAVGTAAIRRRVGAPETEGQPYGEVKRMYVEPGCRGSGLGAQLLQAVEAAAAATGCRWALLETGRDQHAAVALYEAAGYRQRGAFGGYPENGLSVFYGKPL